MYPRGRHHPEKGSVIVHSMEEDEALGDGWCSSPAEFGVETCPGERPDKKIAANKPKKQEKRLLLGKEAQDSKA